MNSPGSSMHHPSLAPGALQLKLQNGVTVRRKGAVARRFSTSMFKSASCIFCLSAAVWETTSYKYERKANLCGLLVPSEKNAGLAVCG